MNESMREEMKSLLDGFKEEYEAIKKQANKDLEIDDIDLDSAVLKTPKIHGKYNNLFTDHTLRLKDLYSYKEKIKLERWKYYSGKQTAKYISENGPMHEKILKTDMDMYLSADEKMLLINDIIAMQKAICDYLERCLKEISSRNFHCNVAMQWRKFQAGS